MKRQARTLRSALILCALSASVAQAQNPLGLSNRQMIMLSAASPEVTEAILAPFFIAKEEMSMRFVLDDRVSKIAKKLQAHVPRRDIHVAIIADNRVNAFAGFGRVYITTGILTALGDDEDAIAGAIAHEMGHASLYHSGERAAKLFMADWMARKLSKSNAPAFRNFLSLVFRNGFSRDQEQAADGFAVDLLKRAGFDPQGMVRTFEMLDKYDSNTIEMLRSHPTPKDRINFVLRRIGPGASPGGATAPGGSKVRADLTTSKLWAGIPTGELHERFELAGVNVPDGMAIEGWRTEGCYELLIGRWASSGRPTEDQMLEAAKLMADQKVIQLKGRKQAFDANPMARIERYGSSVVATIDLIAVPGGGGQGNITIWVGISGQSQFLCAVAGYEVDSWETVNEFVQRKLRS